METKRLVMTLSAGALALSLAPSADAQNRAHRGRPGGAGSGGSYIRQLPPEPLGPNSLGLIEQGFQIMRNSSNRPNEFLYGRWNPRYEVVRPPVHVQPGVGGGYYYPPVYGYPGYPYGYVPQYGGYGYGYQGPVVQREIYIYGNGAAPNGAVPNGQYGAAAPGAQHGGVDSLRLPNGQNAQPAPRPSNDDFYLRGGTGEADTLSSALDEIRKAWLNGDFNRLQARIRTEGKLKLFVKGELKYSVDGQEFAAMIKDAMAKIDTLAFEFDRPKSEESGRAFVTGKHTFLDQDKQKQTTSITYTLERFGGKWKIVEAGSSPTDTGAEKAG